MGILGFLKPKSYEQQLEALQKQRAILGQKAQKEAKIANLKRDIANIQKGRQKYKGTAGPGLKLLSPMTQEQNKKTMEMLMRL